MGHPLAASRRVIPVRWLIAAYLVVCTGYFVPGASWNPVSRFALTRAIVERQTFEITEFAPSTGDRAHVGDRFYSDKAPIPSLLAVPGYAAFYVVAKLRGKLPAFEAEGSVDRPARRVRVSPAFRAGLFVCTMSTAGLAAAFIGVALYELLRRRVSQRAAVAASLATVLGTPLYPYATSFFGHTIAAAFLLGAFALLALSPARVPRIRLLAAGAALGAAAGSEYLAAVPAAVLAAWFVVRSRREQRLRTVALTTLGALAPLALVAVYHQVCFGAPWQTGYAFVTRPTFAAGHAQGLLGLTYPKLDAIIGLSIGRARGLFYVAPVCAVAVAAGVLTWLRERSTELLVTGAVLGTLFVANASYYMWNGGWATGPRHWVPAFGFLGLALGHAFARPGWRVAAFVTAALSALVMVLTTAVGLEAPPQADAIFDYLLPELRAGHIARISGASNLGIELGLNRRWSILPLLVWMALGAWWLAELPKRQSSVGIS
jgi:uncharacterized membrane protein (UPF0136 family)